MFGVVVVKGGNMYSIEDIIELAEVFYANFDIELDGKELSKEEFIDHMVEVNRDKIL